MHVLVDHPTSATPTQVWPHFCRRAPSPPPFPRSLPARLPPPAAATLTWSHCAAWLTSRGWWGCRPLTTCSRVSWYGGVDVFTQPVMHLLYMPSLMGSESLYVFADTSAEPGVGDLPCTLSHCCSHERCQDDMGASSSHVAIVS